MDRGAQVISTYQRLVTKRQPLDAIWSECFKYSYPLRGQGFLNKQVDGYVAVSTAKQQKADLLDSTSTDSVRLLASSVLSALTPPNQQWFSLAVQNIEDEDLSYDDREWLEDSAEKIFTNIHASNYDAQALEFFTDEMVGGMVGLYVEIRNGNYFFEVWPLSTLYCSETLGDGYIDTVYRQVFFTSAEAAKKFGLDNLPDHIREAYSKDPYSDEQFPFVHAIRPRLDKKGRQVSGSGLSKKLPFESLYVCTKSKQLVYESGYHEMPVIIPRWMRIPDTHYALGPMYDALPDTKTINKVVELMLQNAEFAIAGVFVAKDDGVFNPATAKIAPRRILMVNDVNNIKPLTNPGNIGFAVQEIQRLQGCIRRTLLADQLGPSEKANMTATEIQTRTNIIRQILGPIFGRLQAEFLVPLITRCFGLALREGHLGKPPQSLVGTGFKITYRSPLARAQKQQELQAIDQFTTRLAQLAQIDQGVLDVFKIQDTTKKIADLLGIDIELLREPREIQEIQKKREQQQAMMAQLQAQASMPQQAQGEEPPVEAAVG